MQLASRVFKARMHAPKSPGVRVIMGLQDVRTVGVIITCKMCEHDAIVQLSSAVLRG
jgi:hypothetical protein